MAEDCRESSPGVDDWFRLRNCLIIALLVLATLHCVQSIFVVNASAVDLQAYGNGAAQMPFQGRIAMMPIVRWAHGNSAMHKAANYVGTNILNGKTAPREGYSAEKMACTAVGLLAILTAVGFGVFLGMRSIPGVWWLPSTLFLSMLYFTYAARSQAQYWYPYDLPHFALFGMAAVCILRGWRVAAFTLFLIDLPMRETCIYLVPLTLAMGYAYRQWKAVPWTVAMVVLWVPLRLYISHRYSANASETGIQWDYWRHSIINPWRWGQLASAFGFLVLPFCFGFRFLTRTERFFVYGSIPGLLCTTLFGVWFETRIWDEWLLPFALLLSLQTVRYLAANRAGLLIEARE